MLTRRVPEATGNFDRTYIWPGMYLANMTEIKEFRDDGNRFKTSFTNPDGSVAERDALVLIFELVQPVGDAPTEEQLSMVGQTIGKKVTDTLGEKSNLYAYFTAITGHPPAKGGDVDLHEMLGRDCLIQVIDNSTDDAWKSYVKTVMPFVRVGAARPSKADPLPPPGDGPYQVPAGRPAQPAQPPKAAAGRRPATPPPPPALRGPGGPLVDPYADAAALDGADEVDF